MRFRKNVKIYVEAENSFGEFIDWFIEKYLITRATEIAAGKSDGVIATRGYFEETGAGWPHVRDHTPGHWGARFDSAVSVLRDFALLSPDSSTEPLTAAGVELLEAEQEERINAD